MHTLDSVTACLIEAIVWFTAVRIICCVYKQYSVLPAVLTLTTRK